MDRLTKAQRSRLMSRIRSKWTRPERALAPFLPEGMLAHHTMLGSPDFASLSSMVAVFVDGDFWHGRYFDPVTTTLQPRWRDKILKNVARDCLTRRRLRQSGWLVLEYWEGEVLSDPQCVAGEVALAVRLRIGSGRQQELFT
jgi:DNA mismatch endonuclease (patch repair protein)